MPESPQKFFLTTPIYYVNARPHIGHAYTTIVADVLARRARAQGIETFFLTGTDEHGQKIERSAAAAGIPPQQFADEVSASFQSLWDRMGLTYDKFIRTTSAEHKHGVQKLFQTLLDRGEIYLSSYTGSYCVSDEAFVDLPPGTPCPDCGRPLETITEENYFFKLSKYQQPIIDLIESNTLQIQPEARRNEVLSFLRGPVGTLQPPAPAENLDILSEAQAPRISPSSELPQIAHSTLGTPYIPGALKDLSISRTSFKWGIPVPGDESHVIYVWLDALANYMTALGYGSEDDALFQKFWPADLHIVGKEIIRFHCVYWPAFLLAAGLKLPKQVVAHGWLLFEESKMSKSKGNIVRTETILDAFGTLCPAPPPLTTPDPTQNLVILSEAKDPCISSAPAQISTPEAALEPTPHQRELIAADNIGKGTPSVVPQTPENEPLGRPGLQPWLSPGAAETGLQPLGHSAADLKHHQDLFAADNLHKGTPSAVPQTPENEPLGRPGLQPWLSPGAAETGLQPLEHSAADLKHQQDLFAADVLRYFLLREIPFGQDGSFSFDALITRYNADLANGYGNLVSRTLKMIHNYFDGAVPTGRSVSQDQLANAAGLLNEVSRADGPSERLLEEVFLAKYAEDVIRYSQQNFESIQPNKYLETVWVFVTTVDIFLSSSAPWKQGPGVPDGVQSKYRSEVLYDAAESIRIITLLLNPILPYATAKVWAQLGLNPADLTSHDKTLRTENRQLRTEWGGLQPGTKLGPLSPIFPRADKGLARIMTDLENPQPIACVTGPNDPPAARLSAITAQHDALTPATDDLPVAPIASEPPSHDPAAGPRTSTLAEPNPGQHVAASAAVTTERPGTPPHTEAQASGIFASQPADASPQITIDDFVKIDLRVAQIVVAERIPKADKLLRLEVDLGYETRQILSGIAEWYTPEELIGRRIVVITNLAPRKMRGLESHGMLLAASAPAADGEAGGKPHLATFTGAETLPLGSRLK